MKVAQSRPTLCIPMDYTVHWIFQARILEWVVFPFSRGSSQPRDRSQVSHNAGRFFTSWTTREAPQGNLSKVFIIKVCWILSNTFLCIYQNYQQWLVQILRLQVTTEPSVHLEAGSPGAGIELGSTGAELDPGTLEPGLALWWPGA